MVLPFALVVGESLIDVVPTAAGPADCPGGNGMNTAVGLGRLGRRAVLVSWIGADSRGQLIADHVAASGVELLDGSRSAPRTSTATVTLDELGQAQYSFDFSFDLAPLPAGEAPLIIHTGSIAATVQPGADKVLELLRRRPGGAVTSYDPNIRPALMGEAAALRPRIEALVAAADIVKVSDEDLAYLYPGTPDQAVAQAWRELGPALVVVTRGGDGALALSAAGESQTPGYPAEVVDTVGAGDSFMSGIIDTLWGLDLLGAAGRPGLARITADQVAQVLDRSARIAAITVARRGANPPWAHELTEPIV